MFGKSSGGYGAITHALRHSDIWSAAACHSGDMGFELCYLPDMPAALRALASTENSIERCWQQLEAARKHPEGSGKVINILAMAASYDPDPTHFLGIRLPVTLDTCELIEERWANWLRQDPVVALDTQADNLRQLKALHIDCGEKNQFNLLYGARRFARRLNKLGIAHRRCRGSAPDLAARRRPAPPGLARPTDGFSSDRLRLAFLTLVIRNTIDWYAPGAVIARARSSKGTNYRLAEFNLRNKPARKEPIAWLP